VQRGVQNRSRTIRVPVHVAELERKAARVERELTAKLGRQPTEEEVAAEAKIGLEKLRQAREAVRTITSLDRPIGEDGDATLGDLVAAPNGDLAAEVAVSLDGSALEGALETLPPTERRVLELRFGLGAVQPASIESVAKELSISRERVKRMEREALEHLSRNRELLEEREAA
jgi:RNA polymerase primary sigma factor